jgi:hypothetical protein
MDNLSGMNDVSAQTGAEWISGPTPTFVSANSFTLVGDQRTNFTVGRRIKTTNTGGTVYSTILISAFGAVTTVTVVNDSGALDAGLSAVSYGLLDPSHSSIDFYHVGKDGGTTSTNVSGTTDIWGIPGTQVHINNTNAIFSFSSAAYAGGARTVIVDASFPLNTSASLSIPGGQNVTTQVGDRFDVIASTQTAAIITNYTANQVPLYQFQTSGQVFAGPASGTTAAAPSFRQPVGSDRAKVLLSHKIASSNPAGIIFGTSDADWVNYSKYEFEVVNLVPTNNGGALLISLSTSGTFSFDNSTAYAFGNQFFGSNQSTYANGSASLTFFQIAGNNNGIQNISSNGGISLSVDLWNPSSPVNKMINWRGWFSGTTAATGVTGAGQTINSHFQPAVNGILFSSSAGPLLLGDIYMYGISKS